KSSACLVPRGSENRLDTTKERGEFDPILREEEILVNPLDPKPKARTIFVALLRRH
ncbi:hypothetical protein LINPERHAP1_LOCUS12456, partial [Linum perenne]